VPISFPGSNKIRLSWPSRICIVANHNSRALINVTLHTVVTAAWSGFLLLLLHPTCIHVFGSMAAFYLTNKIRSCIYAQEATHPPFTQRAGGPLYMTDRLWSSEVDLSRATILCVSGKKVAIFVSHLSPVGASSGHLMSEACLPFSSPARTLHDRPFSDAPVALQAL
jgi:hypothetical protein